MLFLLTIAVLQIRNFQFLSHFKLPSVGLQPWTKYLRQTIVFIWNSVLQEKFYFYFSRVFCQKFLFWEDEWALGYNSMKIWDYFEIIIHSVRKANNYYGYAHRQIWLWPFRSWDSKNCFISWIYRWIGLIGCMLEVM